MPDDVQADADFAVHFLQLPATPGPTRVLAAATAEALQRRAGRRRLVRPEE
jgi:hypothetical protein